MATDFAQQVKEQADIVKIIGDYVRLRKAGAQNFTGLCPFHKEKTPSFSVHAGRQFFNCFGCHEHGDVFTFIQKIENVGFSEAIRTVAQKCGIPLPKREFSSPEEAAEHRQRGKLLDLHEAATAWFEEQLRSPEGALAREYLTGRGLTADGIAKFRIGFAPDNFHALRERLQSQADPETLRASGLFSWKEQEDGSPGPIYARFRKRIMFPIANEGGRVIAFTARTLETGEKAGPKYLNSPETALYSKSHVLFNLDKARQVIRNDGGAILVEGQMDCISVYLAGIPNVIATSGTAFTESQTRLLRRYATKVIVNFDPDTAGANAAEKSIALLTEEGFEVRVLTLEGGLDPDRYIRDRGARAYAEALRGAPSFQTYLTDRARQLFPARDPKSKTEALNFLLPHIRRIPSRIARDAFAIDAAQALGIDSALVRAELKDAAAKRRESLTAQNYPLTHAERTLLQAFSAPRSSDCYIIAEGNWHQHHAEFTALRSDVRIIVDELRNRADGADPMTSVSAPEHRQLLAELFLSIHDNEPGGDDVDAAILAIRCSALEQQQRQLRVAIEQAERAGKLEEIARLTRENQEVTRKLRDLD
ncbi:MAG TPA: DNA primase [Acidobacteriaceae bacterium]|jgi:DNA primase|nr:DNA primase [Acidobacteriaceae bacterium]